MMPERLDYIITCGRYAGKALMPHHDIILHHTGQQLVAHYRSSGKILFKINCSADEYRKISAFLPELVEDGRMEIGKESLHPPRNHPSDK